MSVHGTCCTFSAPILCSIVKNRLSEMEKKFRRKTPTYLDKRLKFGKETKLDYGKRAGRVCLGREIWINVFQQSHPGTSS